LQLPLARGRVLLDALSGGRFRPRTRPACPARPATCDNGPTGEPRPTAPCPFGVAARGRDPGQTGRGVMDTHTLELLEFDKIRALVAARAACALGKEAARRMEPSREPGEVRERQALTTEMSEALTSGLTPP